MLIFKLLIAQPYICFQDDRVFQYPYVQVEPYSANDCLQVLVPYWKVFLPWPVDKWYYSASIKFSAFKFMSPFESYKGVFFYGHGHIPESIMIGSVSYLSNIGCVRSSEVLDLLP